MLKIIIIFLIIYISNVKAASTFITNGTYAESTPFHAHLLIRPNADAPPSQTYVGSGAIISNTHVLTVAQNVEGFGHWTIQMGNINRFEATSHSTNVSAVHPNYNPTNLDNNLAIITMEIPIEVSPTLHYISLPTPGANIPLPNEVATVTGFGLTAGPPSLFSVYLKELQLVVQPQQVCADQYPHLIPLLAGYFCTIKENDLTFGNICGGDQGAPFFVRTLPNVLLGIASFTNQDCTDQLAVFIRISQYVDWINSVIQ